MDEDWLNRVGRGRKIEVVLALCGLVLAGAGVFWWRGGGRPEPEIEIISQATREDSSEAVFVDVAGAVSNPGMYRLVLGARVEEAIATAGGVTAEADGEWMERYLNRSAKLVDGMKIYIPSKIQNSKQTLREQIQNINVLPVKININSAGQAKLEELPGVGPVTAGKIIAGRPYSRPEELVERKIVNKKVWEQIRDRIAVW